MLQIDAKQISVTFCQTLLNNIRQTIRVWIELRSGGDVEGVVGARLCNSWQDINIQFGDVDFNSELFERADRRLFLDY